MKSAISIRLNTTPEQAARLRALQQAFAQVCNTIAPIVRDTRCWNRVALHHMVYHDLRERFPQMGSQMVCNAIYAVSRTSRLVYQAPGSPFNVHRWGERALPLLNFASTSPVYFDRHTLSLKGHRLSMYTLDGRMRFDLNLTPEQERRFLDEKLHEIMLSSAQEYFTLTFLFDPERKADVKPLPAVGASAPALPDYVNVLPDVQPSSQGETA